MHLFHQYIHPNERQCESNKKLKNELAKTFKTSSEKVVNYQEAKFHQISQIMQELVGLLKDIGILKVR